VRADGELARGREAGKRLAWADAYTALSAADQSISLTGEDLEPLASATAGFGICLTESGPALPRGG